MNNLVPRSGLASGAAALWIGGAHLRARFYQTGLLPKRRLRKPVISIGNLAWGGTGKTPLTIWLAARLQQEGLGVSILTRGYHRSSREKVAILPPGTSPEAARAYGDEVQVYLRHLKLPIGISSSRFAAGTALEQAFPVDVHILDDGFQHLSLDRDVDLVAIDASNPWGARLGFPLLLREGFSSLRRAHAVLLTRCELAGDRSALDPLKTAIGGFNPQAPCFEVRTRLMHFAPCGEEPTLSVKEIARLRPFAFCALGNPGNFLRMMARSGIEICGKKLFTDHHRYSIRDIEIIGKLAQENRAGCLIATEKDIVNLPVAFHFPVPLYWAAIEPEVEKEEELLRWILEKLGVPSRSAHADAAPSGNLEQPHLAGAG